MATYDINNTDNVSSSPSNESWGFDAGDFDMSQTVTVTADVKAVTLELEMALDEVSDAFFFLASALGRMEREEQVAMARAGSFCASPVVTFPSPKAEDPGCVEMARAGRS